MAELNLPYGIDDFETVRRDNCYYIDKTGFIRELLNETFSVNLITRPRRFGKTLTMSMLAEFFDVRISQVKQECRQESNEVSERSAQILWECI